MKQFKFTTERGKELVDTTGNHFVNGKCVNPKVGEGEIGDTHQIPDNATASGVTKTGRITEPIEFTDEFGREFKIEP